MVMNQNHSGDSAKADIVFCLDSSSSMAPVFSAVRDHLKSFIDGLEHDHANWDVRYEFVSHKCPGPVFCASSVHERCLFDALYSGNEMNCFTKDQLVFKDALGELEAQGDEANFVALDFCLDLPWRPSEECRRVLVMLTDETLSTGKHLELSKSKIDELIEKCQDLRVSLFIIGPQCPYYEELSEADKAVYMPIEGSGLSTADFSKIFESMGKSVSTASTQKQGKTVKRGIFDQKNWETGVADPDAGEGTSSWQ